MTDADGNTVYAGLCGDGHPVDVRRIVSTTHQPTLFKLNQNPVVGELDWPP